MSRPKIEKASRFGPKAAEAGAGFRPYLGVVFAATLAAYLPALRSGLIWNDSDYVTKTALRSLGGLWRIWTQVGATEQYYPVLHTAFWLEHRLWGDWVAGYHLINVLLHATAACLFASILRRLAVPGARLAGLIFAVHPVCVESVAWVSEQKNTLSTVFYLGAALAYLRWRDGGDALHPQIPVRVQGTRTYLMATFLFVLAVLSKSVAATLPAALLVVAWWRWGRLGWKDEARALLPWFLVGAAAALFTGWVERTYIGANGAAFDLGFAQRCLVAGRAVWFYLGKLGWPANLSFIYARWSPDAGVWWQWLYPAGAVALTAALWAARGRSRAPLAVWLLFVGALAPTLGFFNVYAFVFSFVADHWQYLAALPVIAGAAAAWGRWRAKSGSARMPNAAAFLAALLLGICSWRQCLSYRDVGTLYRSTLSRNPDAWLAHNNLGSVLLDEGRPAEAIEEFRAAQRIAPWYPEIYYNTGLAFLKIGRAPEAISQFQEALRLSPGAAPVHLSLGDALDEEGRRGEALAEYQEAIRLDPGDAAAHFNLGVALENSGRFSDSIAPFVETLRLRPGFARAHNNLGIALAQTGRIEEAIAELQAAVRCDPGYAAAHDNLGLVLRAAGRTAEAQSEFEAAARLQPGSR